MAADAGARMINPVLFYCALPLVFNVGVMTNGFQAHVRHAVEGNERFDYLKDFVAEVPTLEEEAATAAERSGKRSSDGERTSTPRAKKAKSRPSAPSASIESIEGAPSVASEPPTAALPNATDTQASGSVLASNVTETSAVPPVIVPGLSTAAVEFTATAPPRNNDSDEDDDYD